MTDHQQAAIEAAANSLRQIEPNLYQNPYNPQRYYGGLAQDAIAAAEPHLRKKWAEELVRRIQASNLGAPLILNSDGTARFKTGPEMRETLCTFIERIQEEE